MTQPDPTRDAHHDSGLGKLGQPPLSEASVESASQVPAASSSLLNVPLVTLGGLQCWTDHAWRNGWRLQQHVFSRHWRLLNPRNVRMAWGSRSNCEAVLNEKQPERRVEHDRVVFLLHGLMRSWRSMWPLGNFLSQPSVEQLSPIVPQAPAKLPATIAYFEYASSRASIAAHARALTEVLIGLAPETRIDLVCHSMGNIVVRYMLGQLQRDDPQGLLTRMDHMVMLGPPNHGSSIARALQPTGIFGLITGPGGRELGIGWQECSPHLATPPFPFAIIAGRLSKSFNNPLIAGEGDFIVTVDETKLDGAQDFLEVPRLHSFLMAAPEVHHAVLNFLVHERLK